MVRIAPVSFPTFGSFWKTFAATAVLIRIRTKVEPGPIELILLITNHVTHIPVLVKEKKFGMGEFDAAMRGNLHKNIVLFGSHAHGDRNTPAQRPTEPFRDQTAIGRSDGFEQKCFNARTNGNASEWKIIRGVWTTSQTGKRRIRVQIKNEKRKRAGRIEVYSC